MAPNVMKLSQISRPMLNNRKNCMKSPLFLLTFLFITTAHSAVPIGEEESTRTCKLTFAMNNEKVFFTISAGIQKATLLRIIAQKCLTKMGKPPKVFCLSNQSTEAPLSIDPTKLPDILTDTYLREYFPGDIIAINVIELKDKEAEEREQRAKSLEWNMHRHAQCSAAT